MKSVPSPAPNQSWLCQDYRSTGSVKPPAPYTPRLFDFREKLWILQYCEVARGGMVVTRGWAEWVASTLTCSCVPNYWAETEQTCFMLASKIEDVSQWDGSCWSWGNQLLLVVSGLVLMVHVLGLPWGTVTSAPAFSLERKKGDMWWLCQILAFLCFRSNWILL